MTEPQSDIDRVIAQMTTTPVIPANVPIAEALAYVQAVLDRVPGDTWHVHAARMTGPVTGLPTVSIELADRLRIVAAVLASA